MIPLARIIHDSFIWEGESPRERYLMNNPG